MSTKVWANSEIVDATSSAFERCLILSVVQGKQRSWFLGEPIGDPAARPAAGAAPGVWTPEIVLLPNALTDRQRGYPLG